MEKSDNEGLSVESFLNSIIINRMFGSIYIFPDALYQLMTGETGR